MAIHTGSKVITLTYILHIAYWTLNNVNNPFWVTRSITVVAFKILIICSTSNWIRTNKRSTKLTTFFPQIRGELEARSWLPEGWRSFARHRILPKLGGWLKLIVGNLGTAVFIMPDWCNNGIYLFNIPLMSGKLGWNFTLKYTGRVEFLSGIGVGLVKLVIARLIWALTFFFYYNPV